MRSDLLGYCLLLMKYCHGPIAVANFEGCDVYFYVGIDVDAESTLPLYYLNGTIYAARGAIFALVRKLLTL